MGKAAVENEGLILDGTKIQWHSERLEAWLNGERIAPITIDCALTRKCNYRCEYCYGQLQANDEKRMTKKVIFDFLDDAAEIGVKGISFVSDGESTCSVHVYDAITHGKANGIDMALGTNGALLRPERLEEILPALTYLRFNISAGEPTRYAEIHGCREQDFHKTVENIRACVGIKRREGLDTTIGLQMVLLPSYRDQLYPLARLGKELGVDYLVIKHCSDDENSALGVNYEDYHDPVLINEIKAVEKLSDHDYAVKAKWSKILSGAEKSYQACYGVQFMAQISGSGLVAPCGMLFNDEKYKRFHIDSIVDTRYRDIWRSDRYWEVMDYLASGRFDLQRGCAALCLQHKVNEYLWDLKQGNIALVKPSGDPPQHLSFI